jgi:hypothetical protein
MPLYTTFNETGVGSSSVVEMPMCAFRCIHKIVRYYTTWRLKAALLMRGNKINGEIHAPLYQ